MDKNSAVPPSLLARFVELAVQALWDGLIATGVSPVQTVGLVLAYVDAPVTIDDYEAFVGAVRAVPNTVWSQIRRVGCQPSPTDD